MSNEIQLVIDRGSERSEMIPYFATGIFIFGFTLGGVATSSNCWKDAFVNVFLSALAGALWPIVWCYCVFIMLKPKVS